MSTVTQCMAAYFDRLLARARERGDELPIAQAVETAEPRIYVGAADDNEWIHWRPIAKDRVTDLATLERQLGITIHASVHEYFNAFWFLALGGRHQRRALELTPVVPGAELDDFTHQLEAALRDRGGTWPWTPLGIETNTGFAVVVSSCDGSVALWSFETQTLKPLESDLATLIGALT